MDEFCSVLLLSAPFSVLTYRLPPALPMEFWHVGARVLVPLGQNLRVGVLLEVGTALPEGLIPKDVFWPIDRTCLFDAQYLDFIRDLSVRQMERPGRILSRVLPAGMREIPDFRTRTGRRIDTREMSDPDRRVEFGKLWRNGDFAAVLPRSQKPRLFSLAADPPWQLRPGATAQLEILRYLDVHGVSSSKALHVRFGKGLAQPLAALLRKGLVREVEFRFREEVNDSGLAVTSLNEDQRRAVDRFTTLLTSGQPEAALLFGVTGSGKTAVYLELAARCLGLDRHVLLLAPEVAIALKLHADVRRALPWSDARLYHGYLNPAERQRIFMDLAAQQDHPCIVVGTRSSLFLPLQPGLVILDEEHDASFKQDEGLIYQARELAYGRVARTNGLLVMGSATPDIKVFHAAANRDIALECLETRVGSGKLPEVSFVDLRLNPPEHGPFATLVRDAILDAIHAGDQVIILHNRRGYAPVLYCETCAEPIGCPDCRVSLTLHKRRELLLCHYCGHAVAFPLSCPQCRGTQFIPLGAGTERLEEFLRQDLPENIRVLRLDRDTVQRAGTLQDTLEAFARQDAQVLVGTQMLSKGHHFPGVTLVVVVDGDLGLNLPDYRATERSFQMLVQVAGRAGRGDKPGRVLIQTRNPGHYCWQFIRDNDYTGFFVREIELRRSMAYPPFVKLALVRISLPVEQSEVELLAAFGGRIRALGAAAGLRVLGPAPAPLAILRGRKRFQCLLKADNWPAIRGVCAEMRASLAGEKHVRMSVDLDPVDML